MSQVDSESLFSVSLLKFWLEDSCQHKSYAINEQNEKFVSVFFIWLFSLKLSLSRTYISLYGGAYPVTPHTSLTHTHRTPDIDKSTNLDHKVYDL